MPRKNYLDKKLLPLKQRILKLHGKGMSTRKIAEKEEVSHMFVWRTVKKLSQNVTK